METKMMENFLVIAECENITKAAEKLHVAQPPLTRQLQAMEEELGIKLFTRDKKRIHITDEGKYMKHQYEQILELIKKSKEQVKEMQHGISGTLYIGASETLSIAYLPEWIEGFKKMYPNVKYDLWSANSDDDIERLENGIRDIALIRDPYDLDKFEGISIRQEPWNALISKENPLANMKGSISLEELSKEELIVPTRRKNEITAWFSKKNLEAHIICEFSPLMNGVVLADRNLGIAICPECARKVLSNQNIVMKEIEEPRKYSGVSLIWRKEEPLSSAVKKFIEYVRECV